MNEMPPGFVWDETAEVPMYARYTARETAELLGVAERTVRRWIANGQLEADKTGGEFRIDLAAARACQATTRTANANSAETADLRVELSRLREENAWLRSLVEKAVSA